MILITDYSNIYKQDIVNMQLRKEDALEILTTHGDLSPENIPLIINESIDLSLKSCGDCQVFLDSQTKEVIAVSGVARDILGNVVWLLGTDKINKYKKDFVKKTKMLTNYYIAKYNYIYNFVDSRYTKAIKWLNALGYSFDYDIKMSFMGVPYYFFYKIQQ